MSRVFGVNVVVGIPSFGMVSTHFLEARSAMAFPLVSSAINCVPLKKPIAQARNEIVEYALSQNANYIFWLDDDVIAPPDSFLRLFNHNKDIINGVYWSKSNPPMPLLFRNHLEGPYYDWHVGDLIEIDAAGNGLTLVKTDVYREIERKLGKPWYSTDYASFPGQKVSGIGNTEDLYFYWKAKKAGFKVWADTGLQALHYDKNQEILFGMPPFAPQAHPTWEIKAPGEYLIADLGSGPISPYFIHEGKVVSFDIREDVKPDVVCDLRRIPVPDETFDIVHSSHVLEHFSYLSVDKVLKEWTRILKVGGELRLVVPNLRYVSKRIWEDNLNPYDYWVLYGEQDYSKNYHAGGFTPKSLRALVESMGVYEDIQIKEGDVDGPPAGDSWNLMMKATKVRNIEVENICPEDIEGGPPNPNNVWKMAVYNEPNVREMTPEEVSKDKEKWGGTDGLDCGD